MAVFLLFATAAVGLTNIIVHGSIFSPVRTWLQRTLKPGLYEVFECYQCMGFWCGLLCGIILLHPPLYFLLYGFSASFLASFLFVIYEFILSKTEFELGPDEPNTEEQ